MLFDEEKVKKPIRIGVVTPVETVKLLHSTLDYFPSIQAKWVIYTSNAEGMTLAEQLLADDELEAVMFVEYCVYKQMMADCQPRIPIHFVSATGNNIYRSLFILFKDRDIDHLISEEIPLMSPGEILSDLHLRQMSIHVLHDEIDTETLIGEHMKYHQQNPGSGSLTTRLEVAKALKREGLAGEWIEPTKQDIMVSLERSLLSTASRQKMEQEVVVGLIEWEVSKPSNELMEELKRQVADFAKQLQSFSVPLTDQRAMVVTTRGVFERITRGYKSIPFIREMEEPGVKVTVGAGFGRHSEEAFEHAEIALNQAEETGNSCCYIVKDDKQVVGPVAMTRHLVYNMAVTDPVLLEKAKESGMTGSYMSKLFAEVNREGTNYFTAQELAHILGVTTRSIHRNLQKWLDAGLVQIVGQEKVYHSGRPRTIYAFNWLNHTREIGQD